MATLSDLVAELETKINSITPPAARVRMSQDYGDETTEFTALGQTRYQIRATHLNTVNEDSEVPRTIVQVEILMHHALVLFSDEQAYQVGQMATDQLAMIVDSFWESMDSVYAVVDDFPAINETPERTGKRISYSVGVQLQLA